MKLINISTESEKGLQRGVCTPSINIWYGGLRVHLHSWPFLINIQQTLKNLDRAHNYFSTLIVAQSNTLSVCPRNKAPSGLRGQANIFGVSVKPTHANPLVEIRASFQPHRCCSRRRASGEHLVTIDIIYLGAWVLRRLFVARAS